MTTQDTIDQAVQVIAGAVKFPDCIHYDRSQCLLIDDPRSVARKLADAGLLAESKCQRECEALRDWDALVTERDDIEDRLSLLLWELTGGKLSKTSYDVPTMVREVESEFEKYAQEDRRQIEAERDAALAKLDRALRLLRELTDPDPCCFDHNGGCQAHGFISLRRGETCPVADARSILEDQEASE